MTRPASLWPRGRLADMALACALAAATAASSCRRREPGRDEPAPRCREACAALTAAGCDRDGSRPGDQGSCEAHCRSRRTPGCEPEHDAYLLCVARQRLDCRAGCSAPLCLERGEGLPACAAEHAALARCAAPCAHAGVVTAIDRDAGGSLLRAEAVRAGCAACPTAERRAPPEAPCSAASVCSQVCCDCPGGRARYLARVCLDDRCVGAERACAALRASGTAPCF